MNLTRIRQSGFQDRIKKSMISFDFLSDQDVYNHLFAEKDEVYILSCEWNLRSDSYCKVFKEQVGILHGSRGIFHKLEMYSPTLSLSIENFTSQYTRVRNLSWDFLQPNNF